MSITPQNGWFENAPDHRKTAQREPQLIDPEKAFGTAVKEDDLQSGAADGCQITTLRLSQSMTVLDEPAAQPEATMLSDTSDRKLILTAISAVFVFIVLGGGALYYLHQLVELAASGKQTEATIVSCEWEKECVGRNSFIRKRYCEILYGSNASRLEATNISLPNPTLKGSKLSVLYLADDSSVVMVGDLGDSAWTISLNNIGWFRSVTRLLINPLVAILGVSMIGSLLNRQRRNA